MQIESVIFDWGGTLTQWHEIDFHAESLALAHAVVASREDVDVHVDALQAFHPQREQSAGLVDERQRFLRRALPGKRRHPVDAVLGEQRQPVAEQALVEEPRFLQHEGF